MLETHLEKYDDTNIVKKKKSKPYVPEFRHLSPFLTMGERAKALAFRERAQPEYDYQHRFIEQFFRDYGPMTEADAVATLNRIGVEGYDNGCMAARMDECRGDRGGGSLRKVGLEVSWSTGCVGALWAYVPEDCKRDRAEANRDFWRDRRARDLKIKARIDSRIARAEKRIAECEDSLTKTLDPSRPVCECAA